MARAGARGAPVTCRFRTERNGNHMVRTGHTRWTPAVLMLAGSLNSNIFVIYFLLPTLHDMYCNPFRATVIARNSPKLAIGRDRPPRPTGPSADAATS
eukprot:282396-Prymnesium_polylepis.2